MKTKISKKAQFGPDALIGVVLVAILGLGGVFFLNTFINGLALHGVLALLDSEIDQRCFYMLLPLVGDEYSRAGSNITETPYFKDMSNYFGGESKYSYISLEFNNTINVFRASITKGVLTNITYVGGYIASGEKVSELRNQTLTEINYQFTNFCTLPVYSPAGKLASADLILRES